MRTAIVALDDDPQVLAAVARDLRERYGRDHQILRSTSAAEALVALRDLESRGDSVILMVVDQRMPEMTGTEFLIEARAVFPDAKTVLLTAYADTEAAITAINHISLDHYLLKPWDPPEELLYPILDELVDAWMAEHPPPYTGVRVIDSRWSPAAHITKDFLARNRIPYRFYDIERDDEAKAIAKVLRDWVGKEIGPIAKPKDIRFGDNLPKTRSGKIMRRLLRSIAKGEEIKQDVSTLENPAILDQLKQPPK